MSSRDERRAVFRAVNERIWEVDARFGEGAEHCEVFCECGREGCLTRVKVPPGLYEAVRRTRESYLVAVGHERSTAERVVPFDGDFRVVVAIPPQLRLVAPLRETA